MEWVSYSRLAADLVTWAQELPPFDYVVGVPRSGTLVATMLGVHMHVDVVTLDAHVSGAIPWLQREDRVRSRVKTMPDLTGRHVRILVVDDSASTGGSISQARKLVGSRDPEIHQYGVVYYAPEADRSSFQHGHREVAFPRLFEWNWLHHSMMQKACFDIDGVICNDPAPGVDDDGPAYREFIANAVPKFIPRCRVLALVSCRLEKYRGLTEQWLAAHGVRYQQLIMMQYATKAERVRAGNHGGFKAEIARQLRPALFVESSRKQAVEISKEVPVLCTDDMTMYQA